jgi:hypothetical protein
MRECMLVNVWSVYYSDKQDQIILIKQSCDVEKWLDVQWADYSGNVLLNWEYFIDSDYQFIGYL